MSKQYVKGFDRNSEAGKKLERMIKELYEIKERKDTQNVMVDLISIIILKIDALFNDSVYEE